MSDVVVLVVGPAGLTVESVASDYREFNRLVGNGSISSLPLPPEMRALGVYAFCDDDAIARGQADNPFAERLGHAVLKGPVVFVGDDGTGEEQSLTPEQVGRLTVMLAHEPLASAREMAAANAQFWADHPSGIAIWGLDAEAR
jgi:hypothetical protein